MIRPTIAALFCTLFSYGVFAQTIKQVNFDDQSFEVRPNGLITLVPRNANVGELIGLAQVPSESDISTQLAAVGKDLFGRQVSMPTQIKASLRTVLWDATAQVVDAKGQRYGVFYIGHVSKNNVLQVAVGLVQAGDSAHAKEVMTQSASYLKQMMLGSLLPNKQQANTALAPIGDTSASPAKLTPAKDINAKPLHPNIQATVEGVYFRYRGDNLVYPVVLFKDGTYWDIDDAPLEYTDFEVEKRSKSAEWGKWRKQDLRYYLTDQKGVTNDYLFGANFFRSTAAKQSGDFLNKAYKKIVFTAGLGPDGVSSFSSSRYAFSSNGRFTTQSVIGASGPNIAAGSDQSKSGTYSIQGHTIVLTYGDGRTIRRFFGFSTGGNPPKESRELIFIGSNPFVDE